MKARCLRSSSALLLSAALAACAVAETPRGSELMGVGTNPKVPETVKTLEPTLNAGMEVGGRGGARPVRAAGLA
jgi:hypothetical protein